MHKDPLDNDPKPIGKSPTDPRGDAEDVPAEDVPSDDGLVGAESAEWPEPHPHPPSENLSQAAERLEIPLLPEQLELLTGYCELLWEWNAKINLTRHTDWDRFAQRDLLDSWMLSQVLDREEEVLDIGTGGGVPGVPLAILRPDLTLSLCDSVGKKARAVKDMVKRLELPIAVYDTRAQVLLEDLRFHSLVARGVGSLKRQLGWLQPHWLSFDRLLAIKGPKWIEERGEARHHGLMHGIELRRMKGYNMPGTSSESVILQLSREGGPD